MIVGNSYADDLKGLYLPFQAARFPAPSLVVLDRDLAADLGIDPDALDLAMMLSGQTPPEGATTLAMAYAGHQFGGFSPSLGDGRAMLLAEVQGRDGRWWDIHLKGSGRTPFSRGADGKAALGPMLREYIISRAMHAMGVPTTRALAVVATGEDVYREAGALPGAVLARVGASHLRVGTFQFAAARGDHDSLRRLLAYAIRRHDPDLVPGDALGLLRRVAQRQSRLIAQWMGLGFVHGVMNTDNMTISGETIDYGPCAFMEAHDPATVFSSIDRQGRYAYGNQPGIARWNLARLAEALLPLIDADENKAIERASVVIDGFADAFQNDLQAVLAAKLGLAVPNADLTEDLLNAMMQAKADHSLTFRALVQASMGDTVPFLAQVPDGQDWLTRWQAQNPDTGLIKAHNPARIPRNHLVEEALDAAQNGDMAPFDALTKALDRPFCDIAGLDRYRLPAPSGFGAYRTFCGT
jgi:serine/tyrosine/threonine adenylyltransferase